jgi:dihydropteroate synthase
MVAAGTASLPKELGDLPFTTDHHSFALIYEYEKAKPDSTPVLLDPSRLSAMDHLQKTTIWATLHGSAPAVNNQAKR